MDPVTTGRENDSSLPVLRGTLSGQLFRWRRWFTVFARCAERCSGSGDTVRHGCRTGVRLYTFMVG